MWQPTRAMKMHLASYVLIVAPLSVAAILFTLQRPASAQQSSDAPFFRSFEVVLWVTDARRSAEFYRTVLEFQLGHYTIANGKDVIELAPSDPAPYAADLTFGSSRLGLQKDSTVRGAVGARYIIEVADAGAYASRLKQRGLSIDVIATTAAGQAFWFAVSDPDGHRFEFIGPQPAR